MLLIFDLESCMVSLIFLIIDIEIRAKLPYISSYFITSELYIRFLNTNTRNNDPIQNNNNNNNNDNNDDDDNNNNNDDDDDDDDDDFNNNISVLNILYKFPLAGVAAQGIICHLRVRKDVIKLQQIISKHKQAFIPTAI